jgi:chromate transporter
MRGPGRVGGPDLAPAFEVFRTFLRLGLISFGGPIAHLGYFRQEFVSRRRWLDEQAFADLVTLCQFLPGPASSQFGFAVGLRRAGLRGGLAAWLGFTLPSAAALAVFALLLRGASVSPVSGWLHGLKIVAVAVLAQAVWSMGKNLCPDRRRASIAVLAAIVLLFIPGAAVQIGVIALGAAAGALWLRDGPTPAARQALSGVSAKTGAAALCVFLLLLVALPLAARGGWGSSVALFDAFYRSGALVFGGGHVVLPLLQAEMVPRGWIGNDAFLAGYGAAQAVPGPLFTFAAYLGATMNGAAGAVVCTVAIFLPGLLLVSGTLPFWEWVRGKAFAQAALRGVNAAVVGLLLAALYDPVFTSAVHAPADLGLALAAFALLVFWKASSLVVVAATALGGAALSLPWSIS